MGFRLSVRPVDSQTAKPVARALVTPTSRDVHNEGAEGQLFYPQVTGADGVAVLSDWPAGNPPLKASAIQVDVVAAGYYPASSFPAAGRPTYDGTHDVLLEVPLDPFA